MKKVKLIIMFSSILLLVQNALSQDDSTDLYKNELGLDVTGTIRFFTKFQNSSDYSYTPTYFLTYRRYFSKCNIRLGIGGGVSNQEIPSPYGDSSIYNYNSSSFDSRLGCEFKSELTKRWQVFYGLDFRFSFGNTKNEAAFFNGNYANGFESHFTTIGFAPILGFRFKLNDRMSLLTEANFSFNMSRYYKNRDFYTPLQGSPPIADKFSPDTKSFYTQFAQPIAIYFVFNI